MMSRPVLYHYGKFPPQAIDWSRLVPLVGPAHSTLGKYSGKLASIPNPSILLTPLMTQEAVLSSRIEGTQAHFRDVLTFEAEGDTIDATPEKKQDIWEVLNYRNAMRHSIELLKELPLCQRVIREAHAILLEGVRGGGKAPGEYRREDNWIGPPGCPIEQAFFVPVSPDRLSAGMDSWERFIHEEYNDRLVQIAILHAEFESLHPFLDGNGRLGRMCIPLLMAQYGVIDSPMFYISAFFEANRQDYYERLRAVSRDEDWTGWCAYFLTAVNQQAGNNLKKVDAVISLYETMKSRVREITHSQFCIQAIDFIFSAPIFQSSAFIHTASIPVPTARTILTHLKNNGILAVLREGSGRRPALYAFPELLNLTEAP